LSLGVLVVGIELGSTYSRIGIYRNDMFEIIPDDQGRNSTPSCVAFTKYGTIVGFEALEQAESNPKNTVCDVR